ncbi:acyl-CoA thioesterase [Corynebacterium sp. zg254]|uniref:Acyl-CoA thioesterase n=1 Tax=Corynebacterium zhongnanshanii TaxID=2768834 RepID=A0ABQ6VDZ6_9CORY|nr:MULTISPECIES: acyl-CoA thioesterase [Corynebacterium]KAB3520963.1 acyl-CoA thioesterase [Corynebacterium zhongnanshanii]MCR5914594.1 acyl-CoA thioesterase [Corynebacterium sp. zg254]
MPFILNEDTGTRRHTCHRELRWSDFDQYQHVNNAKYLEFAQDAKMNFLKDVLLELDIAVPPFFVRHATIDYPHPLSPGEAEVAVDTWITKIGQKSCVMRQEMKDSIGRVATIVDTVMVGMDPITGKSRAWTDEDIQHLRLFYIPDEAEEPDDAVRAETVEEKPKHSTGAETRANRSAEALR